MKSSSHVVVPCYNEAARLDVQSFLAFDPEEYDIRFLFVDDGSTDETADVLAQLCAAGGERFSLHRLPVNSGKAEAVRQGMLEAFRAGPDAVGFFDADLASPLEAIPELLAVFAERPDCEIVFGARVRLLGRRIRRKAVRHYLGRIFATAVSLMLRCNVYDTQCGAKFFRNNERNRRLFERPFLTRWIFDVELLARHLHDSRSHGGPDVEELVYEFPLTEWRDVEGSKVRPKDFAKAIIELAMIHRNYIRKNGNIYANKII